MHNRQQTLEDAAELKLLSDGDTSIYKDRMQTHYSQCIGREIPCMAYFAAWYEMVLSPGSKHLEDACAVKIFKVDESLAHCLDMFLQTGI